MRPGQIAPLALLGALALLGCPQVGVSGSGSTGTTGFSSGGSGSPSSAGSGSGSGSGSASSSAGTSAGTSGTSASSGSTGSSASCGAGGSPPAIACSSPSAGANVVAGQAVEVSCTGPSGVAWSVSASLAGATVQDRLSLTGKAYVTFAGASLPANFADTQVTVTVSACNPNGAPATSTVTYTLIGNTLAARPQQGTVDVFTSDGVLKGNFIGPGRLNQPNVLLRLSDGSLLVGGEVDGSHDPLQHYDAQGNPAGAWDITDHSGQALFSDQYVVAGAAEDGQGNVWVSARATSFSNSGKVYRFTAGGLYLDAVPTPSTNFNPANVARLPSGDMVVANAYHSDAYVVLYPGGGSSFTDTALPEETCYDNGASVPVSCQVNSSYFYGPAKVLYLDGSALIVGEDAGSEALIFSYDSQLRFKLATAKPAGTPATEHGFYNVRLGGITRSGDVLVASQTGFGCLLAVSTRTLFDPNPSAQSETCWNPDNGDLGASALVHLGN